MRYSTIIPTTLSLISTVLAGSWDPNSQGADWSTLTPTGSVLGDTNPTGTLGLVLYTDSSSKQKRSLHHAVKQHKARKSSKAKKFQQAKKAKAAAAASRKTHQKQKQGGSKYQVKGNKHNKAKGSHKDAVVTQIGDGQIQAGTDSASTPASTPVNPSGSSCAYSVVTSYSSSCYPPFQ
ncbi:unnamed protein product [Ambrosiozyma monospora]|uniref:Unnamed protein product n=1 Tax=Ambrosiozyma monospora TaxID=43982 RepID=A0ACB5SZW3_AMBMO|nr:unnamed protein product [Ambrosiozyma monospora]